MKYSKLTDLQLMQALESRLRDAFNFKMDCTKVNQYVDQFLTNHLLTASGKMRYTQAIGSALRLYWLTRLQTLENEHLIFCYEIDGQLYTTYKQGSYRNWFKGSTDIPNYRDAGKEDRLIEIRKNNQPLICGFYYPCGKPYHSREA